VVEAALFDPSASRLTLADELGTCRFRISTAFSSSERRIRGDPGPAVTNVFNYFSGLGRDDRIRYDAPSWHGITPSVSAADGGAWDIALRHAGESDNFRVVGALAYADATSRDDPLPAVTPLDSKQLSGSLRCCTDRWSEFEPGGGQARHRLYGFARQSDASNVCGTQSWDGSTASSRLATRHSRLILRRTKSLGPGPAMSHAPPASRLSSTFDRNWDGSFLRVSRRAPGQGRNVLPAVARGHVRFASEVLDMRLSRSCFAPIWWVSVSRASLRGAGPWYPLNIPSPQRSSIREPGVLSGSTGEFVLFGRAPAAANRGSRFAPQRRGRISFRSSPLRRRCH